MSYKPDYETIIQRLKDGDYEWQYDIADDLGPEFSTVETTNAANGYPSNLLDVIIHRSKKELIMLRDELQKAGIEVEELLLNRKNGWELWHRKTTSFDAIDFTRANDDDYICEIETTVNNADQIKDEIYEQIYGFDHEFSSFQDVQEAVKNVNSLAVDIPVGHGLVTCFYDGVNGHNGEWLYIVTEDSAGYHDGDVTEYQLALRVIIPE